MCLDFSKSGQLETYVVVLCLWLFCFVFLFCVLFLFCVVYIAGFCFFSHNSELRCVCSVVARSKSKCKDKIYKNKSKSQLFPSKLKRKSVINRPKIYC